MTLDDAPNATLRLLIAIEAVVRVTPMLLPAPLTVTLELLPMRLSEALAPTAIVSNDPFSVPPDPFSTRTPAA